MLSRAAVATTALSISGALLGCSTIADPRPQLILAIDTDAPVHGQLARDPSLPADAAVDALRVDLLPTDGGVDAYETRSFLAPDVTDWPVSFGVRTDDVAADTIRMRIRIFAGVLATPGRLGGDSTLDPEPSITLDRVVEVPTPRAGIDRELVTLGMDCIGTPNAFASDPPATCVVVGGEAKRVPATSNVTAIADETTQPSVVGTWRADAKACPSEVSVDGAVCVPGGYDVLGDISFVGIEIPGARANSAPLKPARVSTFAMDRDEMTVGRFRGLVAGGYTEDLHPFPVENGAAGAQFSQFCTWPAGGAAGDDDLPLNCVSYDAAVAICAAAGGLLPTEAQWNHEARGRGQSLRYPWGDALPDCCSASTGRDAGIPKQIAACEPAAGIEPVGSHVATCPSGAADVSVDGVRDLAGSLTEILRDGFFDYGVGCWAYTGVPIDPTCEDTRTTWSARGAAWTDSPALTAGAFRLEFAGPSALFGFRCVYPDGAF